MKERIVPIFSLIVLFALVGSMAYFGQAPEPAVQNETMEVAKQEGVKVEDVKEVNQEVVEKENAFEQVETPELILTKLGAAVANNYNYATLDRYSVDDYTVSATVSTDAGIYDTYYELLDENGNIVYKGTVGLSFGVSGDSHNVSFNKLVFDNKNTEQEDTLNPEWKDCKIRFHLLTGKDTSVIIEPIET